MTRAQRRLVGRGLFYILLTIIALYLVFPFYWAIRSSITPDNQLFVTPVVYWPDTPTLINYQLVLGSPAFLQALANSAVVATVRRARGPDMRPARAVLLRPD